MSMIRKSIVGAALLILSIPHFGGSAERPELSDGADTVSPAGIQVMESLSVRVVDPAGQPVPDAVVRPWALRSSQGHGLWKNDGDPADAQPKAVSTNKNGEAAVAYPHFRNLEEGTRTTGVSLFVDHREYAFPDAFHVDVPLEQKSPHEVKLDHGVPLELRPLIDGRPTDTDHLFVLWSGGRSWQSGDLVERTAESTLRLPPLKPGVHSVLVAKLAGDRVTHFSEIMDVSVSSEDPPIVDVPLNPVQRIEGVLSDHVPRPVGNGRIKFQTLDPTSGNDRRVTWFSWALIRPDGTFTIEAWPTNEKVQLIALCDGFIAKSGEAPAGCENPRDPANDPFERPQVFSPSDQQPITVQMEPLVECVVTAVDEDDKPVAGITVASWPNVYWWGSGSQIYCDPLVRCERLLRVRDYQSCIDNDYPEPFEATTDTNGNAILQLPHGREGLTGRSDLYELAVFRGRRSVPVELVPGQRTEVTLQLQPRGTEKLGEWDKLAGVVFGCSTREGRRICALPEVRKKMDEITKRFAEAKNRREPKLLAETYTIIAEAFAAADDLQEAAKWRQKAAEQSAKTAADNE